MYMYMFAKKEVYTRVTKEEELNVSLKARSSKVTACLLLHDFSDMILWESSTLRNQASWTSTRPHGNLDPP